MILILIVGFIYTFSPEIISVLLLGLGIFYFLKNKLTFKPPLHLAVLFIFFWVILTVRTANWSVILFPIYAFFWLNALKGFSEKRGLFFGLFFGLSCLALLFASKTFGFLIEPIWQLTPTVTKLAYIDNYKRFTAVDKSDAWALQLLDYQGSGVVSYQVEMRMDKPQDVNIWFSYWGKESKKIEKRCSIKSDWTFCQLEVELPERAISAFGFGGAGTWKTGDADIEIRNMRLTALVPPSWQERLDTFSRAKGFSFNENAFGSQVVMIGLIAVVLASSYLWFIVPFVPALLCIFLSGSRAAFIAFIIGLAVLLIMRSRLYRLMPWLFVLGLLGIFIGQVVTMPKNQAQTFAQTPYSVRALNVVDNDSARSRIEIWRLAIKVWLENPRTFLIGTGGDLVSALQINLDTRASRFGVVKESLTHAHNLWLNMAVESGLVGLCAMLWLWLWVVLRAWRARDAGALALLAAIFVINSVDYLFFYAPVHLAFWMAAAGFKKSEKTISDSTLPSVIS